MDYAIRCHTVPRSFARHLSTRLAVPPAIDCLHHLIIDPRDLVNIPGAVCGSQAEFLHAITSTFLLFVELTAQIFEVQFTSCHIMLAGKDANLCLPPIGVMGLFFQIRQPPSLTTLQLTVPLKS